MFQISAYQTTSLLPDPEFSDTESLTAEVKMQHAMDGTLYVGRATKEGRRKLQWTFQVTRNKGLELRAFLFAYFASEITVTDHYGRVWVGHFTNNPFELTSSKKAGPAIQGWPRGETQEVQLEFEGVQE